jgi:hypothetical protein
LFLFLSLMQTKTLSFYSLTSLKQP